MRNENENKKLRRRVKEIGRAQQFEPKKMPNPRDERSPSADGSLSPRGHRWRSRSRSKSPSNLKVDSSTRAKSNSPARARSRSRSPVKSRRSSSRSPVAANPGNNLYVTGLSTRVTNTDLEKYFSKEGKVTDCQLVVDPRTKESRGFAFVTMETASDADRCIKYLNRSVLEGRLITVEKARRSRGRTPTPGRYQGLRERKSGRGSSRRSRSRSPARRYDRDPYSRDRRSPPIGRRGSERYETSRRHRERSISPRR